MVQSGEMVKREVISPRSISDEKKYSAAWHSNLLLPKLQEQLTTKGIQHVISKRGKLISSL